MRYALIVLLGLLCWVSPAAAQVSIGIGLPGVSIGINMGSYPELAPVPDYPVYYAPRGDVNLFFYDGMYWAYQRDNWYASSWYNGPWGLVGPEGVPAFVLRIPVRYYRHPPASWSRWQRDAPPHWGERWGHEWEQHRKGWDQGGRHPAEARAPLPVYQRQYSGNRYPREEQQQALLRDKYRYQPKEPVVREHYQQHGAQPQPGDRRPQANQRSSPPPPPQHSAPSVSRSQQPQPVVIQHEPQTPRSEGKQDRPQGKGQDKADPRQPQHGPEQGKGQERGQEQDRGQGHNK
jgi:hypothetical protein